MIVFVWFCMKFVWPPMIGMIEERQTKIAEGLAAAEKGSRSLEEAQAQIAAIVEEARGQARQIIDQANQRANAIVEEARAGAAKERDRILASAQAEVEQEVNRARDELRGQVAAIAVAGAEKILAREIDGNSHQASCSISWLARSRGDESMAQSEAVARPYAQAVFELAARARANFGAWSALLGTAAASRRAATRWPACWIHPASIATVSSS